MKLVMRFGAAMTLAAAAACNQTGQDNTAQNMDANSAMTANESVLPVTDENAAGTDTLGNQLDQLNESGNFGDNTDANAAGNSAENATD